jgi:hypothetical protein
MVVPGAAGDWATHPLLFTRTGMIPAAVNRSAAHTRQIRIFMLISFCLVATARFVVACVVGSELCLPSARSALRTGNPELWRTACRLVALGEWAMIIIGLSFLLLAEHLWHRSDGAWPGRRAGLLVVYSQYKRTFRWPSSSSSVSAPPGWGPLRFADRL